MHDEKRAFSLMEMLVVIAVVTVLMSLMVPAVSSVRDSTQSTHCRTNLRQMGIATQLYTTEYRSYPLALQFDTSTSPTKVIEWDWVKAGNTLVGPGPLWQFTNDPDHVMQCPSFDGSANSPGDPYTGYNYNTTYIGGEAMAWNPSVIRGGTRPSRVHRPTNCAMFGCAGFSAGGNKFMRAPMGSEGFGLYTVYSGAQAFRHQRTCNVAHVDGSVVGYHHAFPGKLANETVLKHMGHPENGFLSDNDDAYRPQ